MISIAFSSVARAWLRMMASVLAIKLPWLTITSLGAPVEPEVGINAASSFSADGAGRSESTGRGSKFPSSWGNPFFLAQSQRTRLPVHAAFACAFAKTKSPEFASVRSSTSTGTQPAYIAPRYASVLQGSTPQLISKRSPDCRPADKNPAAQPTIRRGTSAAGTVCPFAASTRSECFPSRSTRRPAKFHSLERCIFDLVKVGFHDSVEPLKPAWPRAKLHCCSQFEVLSAAPDCSAARRACVVFVRPQV